jgi:ATP adenylyltransferase
VPRAHAADLDALSAEDHAALTILLQRSIKAVKEALRPDGFNLGMNLGTVAGAGIAAHCHWHVVPRWNGDTNFMPVVGDVKVLSESLLASYDKLAPLFA